MHIAAVVKVAPVHDELPHGVPGAATRQAPAPSHSPVLPQGGALPQRASAAPPGRLAQAPDAPATLHALQLAQGPELQQTPSVQ